MAMSFSQLSHKSNDAYSREEMCESKNQSTVMIILDDDDDDTRQARETHHTFRRWLMSSTNEKIYQIIIKRIQGERVLFIDWK